MKPITYYLNFPLTAQIERCLDALAPDQKIELAFAIGQRALDEKRSLMQRRREILHKSSLSKQDKTELAVIAARLSYPKSEEDIIREAGEALALAKASIEGIKFQSIEEDPSARWIEDTELNFETIDPADSADFLGSSIQELACQTIT